MLKPQDIMLLIKLLAHSEKTNWPQRQLASELCMSLSEVNAGIKRLLQAGLLKNNLDGRGRSPIVRAAEEYLVHGVKYNFPAQRGEHVCGIATSIAAPVFKAKIVLGNDPIPVWPSEKGDAKGIALKPLYHSIVKALLRYPDKKFYDLLALVDVIRHGKVRERKIAIEMLHKRLSDDEKKHAD